MLSPPEQSLLALVREGRVDAEIAVRLGLPTSDVKARIERLQVKLGVADRAALRDLPADWNLAPRLETDRSDGGVARSAYRSAMPMVGALVVALVVIGALSVILFRDTRSSTAADSSPSIAGLLSTTPAAPTPPATAVPLSPTTVAGREMYDVGKLFVVAGNPFSVDQADPREALTAIYLSAAAVAHLADENGVRWVYSSSPHAVSFLGTVGGDRLQVSLVPEAQTTGFVLGASDSAAVYSMVPGGKPVLTLRVSNVASDLRRFATLNASGELFVATADTPVTVLTDEQTGEALDIRQAVSSAAVVSSANSQSTTCDGNPAPPSPCHVQLRAASPVLAPFDGTVSCSADGDGLLTPTLHSDWVIIFKSLIEPMRICDTSPGHPARAGDEIFDSGLIEISARDSNGPLSVAINADNRLLVGTFMGTVGCPCRFGS
jgi:hypothetical protein